VIGSRARFYLALGLLGSSYVILILAMLIGDLAFTTPDHVLASLRSPEIRYAIKLSLVSCFITTILSLWVAVPLGYLLARTRFPGQHIVDTILDIPIVLPPLVIGLSLLIFFQTRPGKWIEEMTSHHMGEMLACKLFPLLLALLIGLALRRSIGLRWCLLGAIGVIVLLTMTRPFPSFVQLLQGRFGTPITYAIPSVILAQFAVSCAFAVRTMRITFEQISPRTEQVALTLGCTPSQAFWMVSLPEAWRGMVTAASIAWARALGEFGPILVFSGATRLRTEVLSTTVFLELSIGKLEAALAVSLLMVAVAVVVLLIMRFFGLRSGGVV
jgi:molybdate transport system permease protein